jgi:hypothetical protein
MKIPSTCRIQRTQAFGCGAETASFCQFPSRNGHCLPRQALDKRKENLKTGAVFPRSRHYERYLCCLEHAPAGLQAYAPHIPPTMNGNVSVIPAAAAAEAEAVRPV